MRLWLCPASGSAVCAPEPLSLTLHASRHSLQAHRPDNHRHDLHSSLSRHAHIHVTKPVRQRGRPIESMLRHTKDKGAACAPQRGSRQYASGSKSPLACRSFTASASNPFTRTPRFTALRSPNRCAHVTMALYSDSMLTNVAIFSRLRSMRTQGKMAKSAIVGSSPPQMKLPVFSSCVLSTANVRLDSRVQRSMLSRSFAFSDE